MKSRIFKVSIILAMILTMTMSNFLFVGYHLISYAVDEVTTNHRNVEFKASMKDDATLSMEVSVKEDGYFNGKITLEEGNFTLKTSNSDYVNKIEGNTITLNQINKGVTAVIDVAIEPVKEERYNAGLLNMENKLSLSGTYRDSSEKDKEISAVRMVNYQIAENNTQENVESRNEIITNKILTVNGEEKRVIQIAMHQGLKENNYPIKKIETNIKAPEMNGKYPKVEVSTDFNTMTAYHWEQNNNEVVLTLSNEANEENKILWKKNGTENTIVTLIYDKEVELNASEIKVDDKIILHNNKELVASNTLNINEEEKDSIVQVSVENTESVIYKGKLYAGIDREFESKTKIKANLASAIEKIHIEENPVANVNYQATIINKAKMLDLLGEEGSIQISNASSGVIAVITKDTPDTEGEITIPYNGEIADIIIETSAPQKAGTLELTNKKVIKAANIENIANLESTITGSYNQGTIAESKANIELREPTTEATLSMNKSNLSTLSTNNVEINAILKAVKEENDLYKNPKLQIIFPQEVVDIKVNSINKLYADEFQFQVTKLTDVPNVGKVVEIELLGEQKNYLNEISQGIQIIINADITFNKTIPTKNASIIMKYTNENGKQAEYETKADFNIASKYGVLVYSKVNGYNEENTVIESTSNENIKGALDTAGSEKVVTIERTIVNNYEEAINHVEFIGNIPEIGEEEVNGETLKSTFVANLEKVAMNREDAKVYYSENGQDWTETIEDITKVKAYKIELQEIKPGEVATISYQLKLPGELSSEQSTYEKLKVTYQYKDQTIDEDYATYLSTNNREVAQAEEAKQEEVNGLGKITVTATSAGQELKDGQEIYEGQTVKETVTLINDTENDLNHIKITVKQDNAIFYTEQVTQEMDTRTGGEMDVTRIVEDESVEQKEFTVETLKKGESKTFEYQFSVKEKAGEETKGTVILEADGIEAQTMTTLTNPIKEAKVKLNVTCNYNEERTIVADSTLPITLSTKNISDKELKDIILELPIPEGTELDELSIKESDQYTYLGIANQVAKFKINSIQPGEQVSIIVSLETNDFEEKEKTINLLMQTTVNKETYISNELSKNIVQEKLDITVTQTGSIEGKEVATGDKLTYTTTIKNASEKGQSIQIIDNVPYAAVIQKAYIVKDGKEIAIEEIENNEIDTEVTIEGNSEIKLIIETVIDEKLAQSKELTNMVEVNAYSQYIESNKVTYQLTNVPEDKEIQNEISGKVWLDENKNGQKEASEEAFKDVVVKAMDTANSNIVKETKTDSEGDYQFTQLPNGKYMIIVEYDNQLYSLTEYRKEGISEDENSDAIQKEVNGQRVAVTDEIEVNNNNTTNIDVGLIKNVIFDLKLDKYLNRVIIQNAGGTRTIEYNKEKLGKVEIDAKQVNNATVLVEYGIDITNEGEIPGYASEIVDHMPNDFKFNSELNKSWYTTDGKDIRNITLANEIIYPGETKTITVTLIKTMTQNNAGTAVNTAEIAKASNEQSIEDMDSKPGNNASNEDDISTAELIISIRTGLGIAIGVIVTVVLVGLIITAVIIIKKRRGENE